MTEKEVNKAIYNKVKDLIDSCSMTALYLTIGLVVAIVVVGVLIYKFKRERFEDFKKCTIGVVVGYAVGDSVKVVDGPLTGFIGTVEALDVDKNSVSVVVSMFGRETPVDLELDQVEVIKE